MEDEILTLLNDTDPASLEKLDARAKNVGQGLMNLGAQPDYTADVAEMQKNGFHWDGYRWVK